MKIINFSNVPVQPFWSAPVQALAPWINRLKNSLTHAAEWPAALSSPKLLPTQTASNDSIFDLEPQAVVQPSSPDLLASSSISLRVVRESDAGIRPDCAGRMVISGRMADVCAELDRMALRAAAASGEA